MGKALPIGWEELRVWAILVQYINLLVSGGQQWNTLYPDTINDFSDIQHKLF